jgi:hypothetical protein
MQPQTIMDVVAHEHIDDLRRQARRARLAAKARRLSTRRARARLA